MKKTFVFIIYLTITTFILLEIILRLDFISASFPLQIQKEILIYEDKFSPKKIKIDEGMPHHPFLHHFWGSNVRSYVEDKRYGESYPFETNSNGWLVDHEIINPKPSNTFRIFYLGDSNTQGIMRRGLNLTNLLEKKIKSNFPNVEIINTGTSSYSTLIYYVLLKKYILNYSPDLIVLNFDMTDVGNDIHYSKKLVVDENGNPEAIIPEELSSGEFILTPIGPIQISKEDTVISKSKFYEFILQNTITTKYISAIFKQYNLKNKIKNYYKGVEQGVDVAGNWYDHNWTDAQIKPINYSMGILEKIFELAKENNVPLILSSSPIKQQFLGTYSAKPFHVLQTIAIKNDVQFINTYEEFLKKYSLDELQEFYFDHDFDHLNVKGNQAWAEVQYPILINYINSLATKNR